METSTRYTTDDTVDVTVGSADSLTVAFAADLGVGESITSASASLIRMNAIYGRSTVSGFIVSALANGTNVVVTWTGSVLRVGDLYLLKTIATLNTGAVVEMLTNVRVIA